MRERITRHQEQFNNVVIQSNIELQVIFTLINHNSFRNQKTKLILIKPKIIQQLTRRKRVHGLETKSMKTKLNLAKCSIYYKS